MKFHGRTVLSAATLVVRSGTIVALVGRNGAGKTTLAKVAVGLLRPDSGLIKMTGCDVTRPRLRHLARAGLFYMPDRGLLWHGLTIRAHLEALSCAYPSAVAWTDAVSRLNVGHLLDVPSRELSGGERRCAEVAMALARQPRCLVADEPLRGVEPREREVIVEAFRQLAVNGCAVLITGHELDVIAQCADRVVWCTGGTTRDLGPPALAAKDWQFEREYHRGSFCR